MRKKIVMAMATITMCVCSVNAYTIGGMYVTLIDCSWGENDKAQQEYEQAKKKADIDYKYRLLEAQSSNNEKEYDGSPGERLYQAKKDSYSNEYKYLQALLQRNKDLELAKLQYEANKNGYIGTYKDSSGNLYKIFFGSNYCQH